MIKTQRPFPRAAGRCLGHCYRGYPKPTLLPRSMTVTATCSVPAVVFSEGGTDRQGACPVESKVAVKRKLPELQGCVSFTALPQMSHNQLYSPEFPSLPTETRFPRKFQYARGRACLCQWVSGDGVMLRLLSSVTPNPQSRVFVFTPSPKLKCLCLPLDISSKSTRPPASRVFNRSPFI